MLRNTGGSQILCPNEIKGRGPVLPVGFPEEQQQQHVPLSWPCYPRSRGAAGRQQRWPAPRGTGAGACGWPRAAPGPATQTPCTGTRERGLLTECGQVLTTATEHLHSFPTTPLLFWRKRARRKTRCNGITAGHITFRFSSWKRTLYPTCFSWLMDHTNTNNH